MSILYLFLHDSWLIDFHTRWLKKNIGKFWEILVKTPKPKISTKILVKVAKFGLVIFFQKIFLRQIFRTRTIRFNTRFN